MSPASSPSWAVSRAATAARSGRRAVRLARAAAVRVRNQSRHAQFRAAVGRNGEPPSGGVALLFCTGPENLYQFAQWRLPLERLAETRPVFVVVDRPDTGEAILRSTTLPVVFARGSAAWETLVVDRDVKVVLYCNQVAANFRMLRFPGPVHVQIGHGESDKATSSSNQHKAYDLTFVGGPAGSDRLASALRGFDPAERTAHVGRPQLDHDYPGAPDWPRGSGRFVWYAPTWEGDRPSIAYGSLARHGVALVEALVADRDVRVVYRPHPRTGQASAAHTAADKAVRAVLARDGDRHLVDFGAYGWQWRFADACVTDVSSVAYDWLATGKPLVVTRPGPTAYVPPSPLLEGLTLLPADQAGDVLARLRGLGLGAPNQGVDPGLAELMRYYFGDTADGASSRRFAAAIERAYALAETTGTAVTGVVG